MHIFVVLIAAIVVLAPPSVLATELDQFMNKVAKSAPRVSDATPPVVCVCKDGGLNHNRAGQLFSTLFFVTASLTNVKVECFVHFFNPDSEQLSGGDSCTVWELLPK